MCIYTYIYIYIHIYYIYTYVCVCGITIIKWERKGAACMYLHIDLYTVLYACFKHTHTHTHTHKRTHTNAHTNANTHTHTHTEGTPLLLRNWDLLRQDGTVVPAAGTRPGNQIQTRASVPPQTQKNKSTNWFGKHRQQNSCPGHCLCESHRVMISDDKWWLVDWRWEVMPSDDKLWQMTISAD